MSAGNANAVESFLCVGRDDHLDRQQHDQSLFQRLEHNCNSRTGSLLADDGGAFEMLQIQMRNPLPPRLCLH